MSRIVIVGASVGGIRTAQALRRMGFAGEVQVLGEESQLPYDKPPLSKSFLTGQAPEATPLLTEAQAADDGIDLLLGHRAVRLDIAARQVEVQARDPVAFDKLVIATGARARPSPWQVDGRVHVLRTLDDARALRRDMARGGHLVIVGAGFIGAEVASAARQRGLETTLIDPLPVPMARLFGDGVGGRLVDLHHRHGVRTRFGLGVASIDRAGSDLDVTLTNGEVLSASTILVGIGVSPNDEWLESSELVVEDGVVCDEFSRAARSPEIYAVGDVARWPHPEHGAATRVEHWTNAVEQAAAVAHNLIHPDALSRYKSVGYIWSDQYDWKIQIAGRTQGVAGQTHVQEAGPAADSWAVLYHDASALLVGAVVVNWPRALVECRRALNTRASAEHVHERLESLRRQPVRS